MAQDSRRELLIGAVGLVKGNVREGGRAMVATCDRLEREFESTAFLADAPFDVVSLIIRYGTKWAGEAEIGKINGKHSELEVAFDLPMSEVRMMSYEERCKTFMKATLLSLITIGDRYNLPTNRWEELLALQGDKKDSQ